MKRETIKRITYVAIGLLIIGAASGCVGQKPQEKAPGKTPGLTPQITGTPAPQVLNENEINSSETDLSQLDSMINDMNLGDNVSVEVNGLTFQ